MGIRSLLAKPFAAYIDRQTKEWSLNAVRYQQHVFQSLVAGARSTEFGRDHGFADIKTYDEFKKQVPIRDYEVLKPY
ncbi:MAG: GH3 auxin-responsive promoter family protein, partial [Bacteroidota bacterium]